MTSNAVCDKTRKRDLSIEAVMFTLAKVDNPVDELERNQRCDGYGSPLDVVLGQV